MRKLELLHGTDSITTNRRITPSEEENNAFEKIFKGVEEIRPELEKNPQSFQGGELLWFCKRGKLSQFQFFNYTLTDMSQANNSDAHRWIRTTFYNVNRWIGDNNFIPYNISRDGRLIYNFIIRRLQQDIGISNAVVKKTANKAHLSLVSNS